MTCADVQTIQAGNGAKTQFSFDFPYIFKSEIQVSFWNVTTKEWDVIAQNDLTYPWQVTDANPTIVEFTSTAPPAPATPSTPAEVSVDNIRIRRVTQIDDIRALFNPGSAIRSDDLNKNFEQLRYAIQESNCQGVPDEVYQYLLDYFWSKFDNTAYSGETWVSDDATLSTTGRIDERFSELKTSGYWDDRYYTETELNSGQLDTRYYTESELDGGQLDNRYYTETELTNGALDSRYYTETELNSGQLDTRYYTETELNNGQLDNRYYTEAELNAGQLDNRYYTETEADARFYNVNTESITSADTWTNTDGFVATTAAIEARIITLVEEVGGFVPISSHTQFPTTNPDISDNAGTVVSIASVNGLTHSGGTSTNATTTGSTPVAITGIPGSLPSPAGATGMLVVTTGTLNSYTFHRLTPEVNDVVNVANNATNINTVAGQISPSNNVGTVAGIAGNVSTVAGNNANVTTVATNIANVNTNATNIANINTVAGINGNVSTVAGIAANVTTVADNTANVNTVAGISGNVTTVAGNNTNVTTVATNIASVNSCATNIVDIQNAVTSAANAAASASAAATSASNASSSATAAAGSASAAATSASAALVSEQNADASEALALQYRDDTAGILTQSGSDAYNVSTNQSWGDIITGALNHFDNEILADILLTMSKGTNTYNYGTL